MKLLYTVAIIFSAVCVSAQERANIIFDTDMGPDYDDAGAIALLHALADSGKAHVLATVASTRYEGVGPVLEIFNSYFGRPEIPVGVADNKARDLRDWQHWSDSLRANYPHSRKTNSEFPGALQVYRRVLASQPDKSVIIITVGFLSNLPALLQSGADSISELNGRELIKRKVKKLVCMAGKFPAGKEFNIEEDAQAAKFVFENWSTPVLFSGFEIGHKIHTGLPLIEDSSIVSSPVKDVFRISIPMAKEDSAGRSSWDQTAVLVGVLGHEPFYTLKRGKVLVDGEGNNTWKNGKGNHYYLVEKLPPAIVEERINKLMTHQPVSH